MQNQEVKLGQRPADLPQAHLDGRARCREGAGERPHPRGDEDVWCRVNAKNGRAVWIDVGFLMLSGLLGLKASWFEILRAALGPMWALVWGHRFRVRRLSSSKGSRRRVAQKPDEVALTCYA